MTDPQHLDERAWKDAEVLVERIEQAARSDVSADSFFEDVAGGLRLTSGASAVVIWSADGPERMILARSGISIHVGEELRSDHDGIAHHASRSRWVDGHSQTGGRLLTLQNVDDDVQLGLDLHFDHPIDLGRQQALSDLAEVVLDLSATVSIRSQLTDLRRALGHQLDRDTLISKLNDGVALNDSFAAIASVIASDSSIERVGLLRVKAAKYRLVATSTQTKIDRRARQVRLLEGLAKLALSDVDRFSFQVGSPSDVGAETSELLEGYLHESGCREIHIEPITDEEKNEIVAVIVLERFHLPTGAGPSIESILDPIHEPVGDAVRNAIRRDDATWGLIASRFTGQTSRRKALWFSIGLCMLVLAACLVPATLKIPVEGRIVAAQQSRLYSPAEGIVAEIAVHNGQQVREGEILVVLHSPILDLQQRNIEAELATARTRLDSLLAIRSRSSGLANRERETSVSADEQVLKKEIDGLLQQLKLVQKQQADLTITSPMDGHVDRWDLQQSLSARPVTYGQHLVDVISAADGWHVELDLPEKNVNYVLREQRIGSCRCTFRLRSDPTKTHEGRIDHVADVAHLNPLGQSMVRASLSLPSSSADDFRSGATVIAQIHCGQYPIGFVWLRGLIEWSRTQAWL